VAEGVALVFWRLRGPGEGAGGEAVAAAVCLCWCKAIHK